MPEISTPFLGCLHEFKVVASVAGALIIEGPLWTAGKVNLNGWGIPEGESAAAAATFTAKPARWCPDGITVVSVDPDGNEDVTPAEHYCDLIDDRKSIVGVIQEVYPNGTDPQNRTVYWHRSKVTNPATVAGIQDGTIPTNVSMWAYGKSQDKDGMVHGVGGKSLSIVTEPAYTEAAFQWRAVAAARKGGCMAASGAYVPKNPKNYGKSTGAWSAPSLKDFTSKSWDDLTEQEKNGIRSCFAAVTDDTFGGCKLPHHNPDGMVVKAGVDNAMARLGQTQGLGSIKSDVEAHLRSHQTNDFKEGKGASMADLPATEPKQTTLDGVSVGASATPGVVIYAGSAPAPTQVSAGKGSAKGKGADAADGDGSDGAQSLAKCGVCDASIPAHSAYCPACGASLHPKCSACGSELKAGAKFCHQCGAKFESPATGTTGDNTNTASASVETAVKAALAASKDEDNRQKLAASILEVQLGAGIVKAEDVSKATSELLKLPASVLESNLTMIKALAAKAEAQSESGLKSLPAMVVVAGASLPKAAHGYPSKAWMDAVFQRLKASVGADNGKSMTMDTVLKYGKSKNFPGCSDFSGSYHMGKDLLPLP